MLSSSVILAAVASPSEEFLEMLKIYPTAASEAEVVKCLVDNLTTVLHTEASLDNLGILLLRAGPERQTVLVAALLPHLRTLMCDPVGYQIMGACLYAVLPEPLKTDLERILIQALPTLLNHEIGVYVVRDLALRGIPVVIDAILNDMENLLATALGCELLSWLVDVPTVGSYVAVHWERLAHTSLRVVLAALRVRKHLHFIYECLLPNFITNCTSHAIRPLVIEMIPLLDIPAMQGLCDKLMAFSGRGPSRLIDMLGTEGGYEVGCTMFEVAEGVTRVLLVDHLRTFFFYLKGCDHEQELLAWATENPNYNEVIVVYDKATSQFYTMDIAYTNNTFNRREWLRLRGKVDHLASVCINFQNDTCRAHERCNMIHVDREIIKSLRPRSCCAEHGHEPSMTLGDSSRKVKVILANLQEIEIPQKHFARTAGWDALKGAGSILICNVCRQHQREACGKPLTCKFIHICRELWAMVGPPVDRSPMNPMQTGPKQLSPVNDRMAPAPQQQQLQQQQQQQPSMFVLKPTGPMFTLPALPPYQPFFAGQFAPFPALYVQQPQMIQTQMPTMVMGGMQSQQLAMAFGDDMVPNYLTEDTQQYGNLPYNAEEQTPYNHMMNAQQALEVENGTLIRRKKYIKGGA